MKKTGSVLLILVWILVATSGIAQQKSQVILKGTDLVIPYSGSVTDSSKWPNLAKEKLMKVEKVICSNKNYEVMSFTVIVALGRSIVETKSSSKFWAPKFNETINQLNSGDKVWIEEINTRGPDGKTKLLRNVVFRIK
jgi:hypothetical protein